MAEVLLIAMPFGPIGAPSIGLSLLKSGLRRQGISSQVRYFSIRFAELLGWSFYMDIANGENPTLQELPGEWIFSRALFDTSPDEERRYVRDILIRRMAWPAPMPRIARPVVERMLRARSRVDAFLAWCLDRILEDHPRIVGFTSTFQQHVASLALARRLKERRPDISIIFGGGNCAGAMGAETVRQFPFVDAAVSGEGDVILPELVERLLGGHPVDRLPGVRTLQEVRSQPRPESWSTAPMVRDLDWLPFPDYSDFFQQFESSRFARTWEPLLFFESSRGCWWGQKNPCAFCGLNGANLMFRSKSPRRALQEIAALTRMYPGSDIQVVDTILDMKYFDNVIPNLAKRRLKVDLFYETKSNLRKEQIRKLRRARIVRIQPGIESLSDKVLKLMRKGVSALQNIQLLKWCKQFGVEPLWNVLWGFPGEDEREYARMANLVPLLSHLHPPIASGGLRLDRFSPHFEHASAFGFVDVQPIAPYRYIYPFAQESLHNLAYTFSYRYRDGRSPENYVHRLQQRLQWWKSAARDAELFSIDCNDFMLVCDLRPRAKRFLTVLGGLDRKIYLAADAIAYTSTLSASLHASPNEVADRIHRLVKLGLMLCEGERVLALAVPLGDYQLPPRSRDRFRRLLRRAGTPISGGTRITFAHPILKHRARKRRAQESIDRSLFVIESERTLIVRDRS